MSDNSTTKLTLKFFWHHVWCYPAYVIAILIAVPLSVLFEQYLPPLVLALVLGRLAKGDYSSHNILGSFGPEILLYIGLLIIGGVGWRILDLFQWKLEANVERDIARRVYSHLLDLSANFHANRFGGSLVSQTNKLMGSFIRFSDTTVFQVLQLLSSMVFTVIILSGRALLFVIILIIFALLFIVGSIFITKKVRMLSAEQASMESKQTGYLADSVTNVLAIKSFAGGAYERKQFDSVTNTTREGTLAIMRASQKQNSFFSFSTKILSSSALIMAILGVLLFKANVATAFLIFSYTSSLVGLLWMFANSSLRNYNRAFGDASDMVSILQIEPEVKDPARPEKVRIRKGKINFAHVDFKHDGANDALFSDFNIEIKPGEKLGLVGHSGSGKTTFTRLVLRFSDIDAGEILIDGQNIAKITQDDLRSKIAYVPQEPIMFHRTIKENIGYGKEGASDNEIEAASKAAHAHEFVNLLPNKYDTLVGERGIKLSGGQRQRIAIARAMLKNAPVLLLDEATSALDSESEALIQESLWKLMQGRTAIVIAHRLSTIQKMDRIVVLDQGKIAEQGTHKELLSNKNGIYAKLWSHQSGGFLEE